MPDRKPGGLTADHSLSFHSLKSSSPFLSSNLLSNPPFLAPSLISHQPYLTLCSPIPRELSRSHRRHPTFFPPLDPLSTPLLAHPHFYMLVPNKYGNILSAMPVATPIRIQGESPMRQHILLRTWEGYRNQGEGEDKTRYQYLESQSFQTQMPRCQRRKTITARIRSFYQSLGLLLQQAWSSGT